MHDETNLPIRLPPNVARRLRQLRDLGGNIDPQDASDALQAMLKRGVDLAFEDVAPGVGRLGVVFVNLYCLNAEDGRWFLVDTGLPGFGTAIKKACEHRFGGRAPEAIILTHAHFDHAGNAEELAAAWNVPIYVHAKEMPYVTGESDYPPADPTPGGAICFLSRFFPTGGYDFAGRVQVRAMPEDDEQTPGRGHVPGLGGWTWLHTPGHSAGHVSLWRDFDKLLVAGDALATMNQDSWQSQVSRRRELARPATPFTPDWSAAQQSVKKLAELEPKTVAAGHGLPLWGRYVSGELHGLADHMPRPTGGRYAGEPAQYDAEGAVADVPPPPPDPLKGKLALATGLAVAGLGLLLVGAMKRR